MFKNPLMVSAIIILLSACDRNNNPSDPDKKIIDKPPISAEYDPPNWQPNAGSATAEFNPDFPFLQFIPNLDLAELTSASQGRELFIAEWTPAPGIRPLLDGLGPLTITSSCAHCHLASGRAPSLIENGDVGVGLLFRLRNPLGQADPYYGGQLQTAATSGSSEGHVSWQLDDNQRPLFTLTTNQFPLTEGINLGPRLSPQLVGIGLLDLVPSIEILSREDKNDIDADGISGRAHWRLIDGQLELGRFGWKAMQPSLKHQSAGAMQQDMGLTTSLNPTEPCTALQNICDEQNNGGSPEVSDNSLTAINDFLTLLAVPQRRISDQADFDRGALLFTSVGCADCHQPTLTTGSSEKYPLLSNQLIYPYTDLLLHDLGEDLNDKVKEGNAQPNEWRTPPLWSLGLIEAVPGSRFLHDGRAETIEQAISWHGGEALRSRQKFDALALSKKQSMLEFLRSI
ncbi:MAG: thiol oxidoreductase [Oleispira sp.]|nr:thiol oxidoreductase [Oleispira sp.]